MIVFHQDYQYSILFGLESYKIYLDKFPSQKLCIFQLLLLVQFRILLLIQIIINSSGILAMQLIAMKNFKSYENVVLNNLNPHINVVIGRNGQGKSNFFKAINFLLTDRLTLNKNQFNAYTHRGLDNKANEIAVQAYFSTSAGSDNEKILYKIERLWTEDLKQQFLVEQKSFSKLEFENYLESIGIPYSNSYHIIQQGKIQQLALLDDFQLFKLLEDASGMRKYHTRMEQTQGIIRKFQLQKKQAKDKLIQVENRLKLYQQLREEYQYHNLEQLANKVKNRKQYEQDLRKNQQDLKYLRQNQYSIHQSLSHLKNKYRQIKQQIQALNTSIAINQKQILEYQQNPEEDEELLNKSSSLQGDKNQLHKKLKQINETKNKLKKEFEKKSKQTESAKRQMEEYNNKYMALSLQLQNEKLSKSGKGPQELKKSIVKIQQNIKQTEGDIKKMTNYTKDLKVQTGQKQSQQAQLLKQKMSTVTMKLKAAKIKLYEQNRIKNQLQSEIDTLSKQSSHILAKLRKSMPLLDISLLKQLRKQKIRGVYGFLIDFLQIDSSVAFAYQIAGFTKLSTLLIEDEERCKQVIQVNKRQKGRQINLLPLSIATRQPSQKHNYPQTSDCYTLLNEDWIKIKRHQFGQAFTKVLQKLINNTFGKYLLVKTYDLALQMSKKYHLNCITAQKQLVYSQGYFCKVGKDDSLEDRLQLYYQYSQKEAQIAEASEKLSKNSKELMALQNVQLGLNKQRAGLDIQIANNARKIEEIQYQQRALNKVQEQIANLERKKQALQSQLKRVQELQANQGRKMKPVDPQQYSKIEKAYQDKQKIYNKRGEQQYEIQSKLQKLANEEEVLLQNLNKVKQDLEFKNSFNFQFVGDRQFRDRLEQKITEQQKKAALLERELQNIEEQMNDRQLQEHKAIGQLSLLTEQIAYCEQQLSHIGPVDLSIEDIEERSHSLSMSVTHLSGRKGKPKFYTAREKIFFAKLEMYRKQLDQHKRQFKKIEESEIQIARIIQECQKQREVYITGLFQKFQAQFEDVFKALTLGGKSDIRLKKTTEKHGGKIRHKNAISILVSFEKAGQPTKKWATFSGGQKSLLSFCILMALQKCEPAPFYVLDEIDAALDPIYLSRVVQFIGTRSANSQYFISSFKKQMLQFPDNICNYYIVSMENRLSRIARIDKRIAQSTIETIVN